MSTATFMKSFLAALLIAMAPFTLSAQEPSVASAEVVRIDINSADAETIAKTLIGVGMVRAKEIVAYRIMYGDFESVEELTAVKGVGPATVDKNRHLIQLINSQ
ncbi:MAG: ComEA family DNA-binding protein [Pseudohongiellaceae bacterium]